MSAGGQFLDYVVEQLAPMRVKSGRFFGGTGLSTDGVQFAMLMAGALYFVVDETTRPRYEHMGSRCFSYSTKKGRVDVRKYYEVPANIIEDPDLLVSLARESARVAVATKTGPTSRSTRPRAKTRGIRHFPRGLR